MFVNLYEQKKLFEQKPVQIPDVDGPDRPDDNNEISQLKEPDYGSDA